MRIRNGLAAAALAAALAIPSAARAQEWRGGRARIDGVVKNDKGEPVAGAKVMLRWGKSQHGGPDLTTDKNGRWSIFGLVGGPWDVDVEAAGYATKKIQIELQEGGRNDTVNLQLEPQPVQAAAPGQVAEPSILVDGKKISKETAAAIEAGNAAMVAKNWAAARESYLKALPEIPDNSAVLQRIAFAYLEEGNKDEAVQYARMAAEKSPGESAPWQLIAEVEIGRGNAEAGLEALSKVPPEKIVDSGLYTNAGVALYNKKKLAEAEAAFDKAIAVKPDATAYYYRGLTRYGEKKMKEAKEDFQKALELAPDGPDAKEIKDLLSSMK
jgi:tetratricopeptide (TPR) repeat protein